jgi:6-phosphogluconolactonase
MGEIDILTNDWRKEHPPGIRVYQSKEALLETLAAEFLELASSCQKSGDRFSVIMGGGRTPGILNKIIIEKARSKANAVNWNRVFIFFSDERCVPPDHPDSNFKLIFDTLIEPLGIPRENVSRILGEVNPGQAASRYHEKLSLMGYNSPHGLPVFDLALLGLGPDGHTASLFPGSSALKEFKYFAAPAGVGPEGWDRVTVTYPVFNAAKNLWLMAAGAEKAQAFAQLINGQYNPTQCPVQAIRPNNGNLVYWIDSTIATTVEITG